MSGLNFCDAMEKMKEGRVCVTSDDTKYRVRKVVTSWRGQSETSWHLETSIMGTVWNDVILVDNVINQEFMIDEVL